MNAGAVVVVGFLGGWEFGVGVRGVIRHPDIIVGSDVDFALAHYLLFLCLASLDDCP